jgi:putative copper export protein
VVCIAVVAAINRFVYLQPIRTGNRDGLVDFVRLLRVEAVLMIFVLAIAAILGHSIPPADSAPT